jgi:FixJ family two-component response regulator
MEKLRILGVDDDPDVLELLRLQLREHSEIELISFGDPLEALDYLRAHPEEEFSLAFVDIRMPRMTGIEFLTHLRELSPRTVNINMSSHADLQLVLDALRSNHIFDFIRKPLNKEDVELTLGKALEHFDLRVERDQLAAKLKEKNALLEQWNQCLDAEVQRKTFELKLRDRLMQHLSGCLTLEDPFEVVKDFVEATVPGVVQGIYYLDQHTWTLLHPKDGTLFPMAFCTPDIEPSRCGSLNPQELADWQKKMNLPRHLVWGEVLLHRGEVVGCWCFKAKTPKEIVPREELSNFAPLVGLLVYDSMVLRSMEDVGSGLFGKGLLD